VLDALKPHGRLEMLRIASYKATSLVKWVTYLILLQHLTELHLVGCTGCEDFPQFCHFKALQVLYLKKLDRLENLCSDPSLLSFPALKELKLHYLHRLVRRVATEGKEVTFPVLETIDIKDCPKLTSLPEAPKLKALEVNESKAQLSLLIVNSRYMSLLSKLTLSAENTEATLDLDCENHESPLTVLNHLCHDLQAFRSLVSLKTLLVCLCKNLIGPANVNGAPIPSTNPVLSHLKRIRIFGCPNLVELFILPQSLQNFEILSCKKLELIWGKEDQFGTCTWLDQPCHSYASASVVEQSSSQANHPAPCPIGCGNLVALPNLPPSLKWLYINKCHELCSIAGQLDALESLSILDCNKLQPFGFRWRPAIIGAAQSP
jgi:hypothetical protein